MKNLLNKWTDALNKLYKERDKINFNYKNKIIDEIEYRIQYNQNKRSN